MEADRVAQTAARPPFPGPGGHTIGARPIHPAVMPDARPSLTRRDFLGLGGAALASLAVPGAVSPAAPRRAAASRTQYKRRGLRAMTRIDEGRLDDAIAHLHEQLADLPGDPEFFYGLAVAHGRKGNLDTALSYVRKALDAGLPPGRFLAGPRRLTGALREAPAFRALLYDRLGAAYIHGPMLGGVSDSEARVWVRTPGAATVRVALRPSGADRWQHRSAPVRTREERDYTGVARITGLSPDTEYTYRLRVDGREQPGEWSFRTFPREGEAASFSIGFGACAGYTPWHEHIWRRIAAQDFPAFMLLGDNVYIDRPERPAVQRYVYYRRQSRPEFRTLTAGTSIAAIWDDHDFGTNDSAGGPEPFSPDWKPSVWRTFRHNWNNVGYGNGASRPGTWHAWSIADVDVFMLDCRYYRTAPDAASPSMLGPTQKQWLFDRLRQSTATFKLIASSVPFPDDVKPGSPDPWQGYPDEREELFSLIEDQQIGGVVLLSGDRHRADVWRIEREESYDLYEFQNGRLTNIHTHGSMSGSLFSYNDTCHFGRLRVDTTRSDPTLTYDIIDINGNVVHSTTLRRSQLSA